MAWISAWRLPGPSAFLDDLTEALDDGASVIVGRADRLPRGLWVELAERCRERGLPGRLDSLELDGAAEPEDPIHLLARHFARDPDELGEGPEGLLDPDDGLEAGVYWLGGLPLGAGSVWSRFLERFAHA